MSSGNEPQTQVRRRSFSSFVSGSSAEMSRRERSKMNSRESRKRQKVYNRMLEVRIARLQVENKLLSALDEPSSLRPKLDPTIVSELVDTLQCKSSKSTTTTLRKAVTQLLNRSSLAGVGVQRALIDSIDGVEALLRVDAACDLGSVLDDDAGTDQTWNDVVKEIDDVNDLLQRIRDSVHSLSELMQTLVNDLRDVVKPYNQALFILSVENNLEQIDALPDP